jgi:hypothetical protein
VSVSDSDCVRLLVTGRGDRVANEGSFALEFGCANRRALAQSSHDAAASSGLVWSP